MPVCSRCLKDKPTDLFTKRVGKYRPVCKECWYDKARSRYKDIPGVRRAILDRQNIREHNFLLNLFEYFKTHPCVDCGEGNPLALEFDHIIKKRYNVTDINKARWETVLKEIAKCEVRCGSCHRIKTHERANTRRYQLAQSFGIIIDNASVVQSAKQLVANE